MIRIIAFIILFTFSVFMSFAQVKTEEILIQNDSIQLPGTLTYTKEKTPLLIWIHGSGGVNRDGNQPQYIKQFRDAINKENIAFFSYDKRTSNPKNVKFLKKGILFNDFVSDAKKVIKHFKNNNRFTKIILVGHSQGSLVAMLASEKIDKYISLAGPSGYINDVIIEQVKTRNPLIVGILQKHFKELRKTGKIKKVAPRLISMFNSINTPFYKSWMLYNPSEEIKKLNIPILIINGTKDLQVKTKEAIALNKANPKSELIIIKNMNHVLKHIDKEQDNMKSYFSADFPLSEKLLETVVTFIKK